MLEMQRAAGLGIADNALKFGKRLGSSAAETLKHPLQSYAPHMIAKYR